MRLRSRPCHTGANSHVGPFRSETLQGGPAAAEPIAAAICQQLAMSVELWMSDSAGDYLGLECYGRWFRKTAGNSSDKHHPVEQRELSGAGVKTAREGQSQPASR